MAFTPNFDQDDLRDLTVIDEVDEDLADMSLTTQESQPGNVPPNVESEIELKLAELQNMEKKSSNQLPLIIRPSFAKQMQSLKKCKRR